MVRRQLYEIIGILFLLFIAYGVMLIPVGDVFSGWRPHVFWLVLMFCVIRRPKWFPLELVFFLGLGFDSLVGSYLGQQAFACVLTAYIWGRLKLEGWTGLYLHRLVICLMLLLVYQIAVYLPLLFLPNPTNIFSFWQSFVGSVAGIFLLAI